MENETRTLKQRAAHELRRFLLMFVYLWVLFGLFGIHEEVVLKQRGISFSALGFALVNALVLAKVMVVVEGLNLARWLHHRALIYPIVFEAIVFAVLFLLVHVAEHVIMGMIGGESFSASVPLIGGGGFFGLFCVTLIMFFALIPFFAFNNLDRVMGTGRLSTLLFNDSRD